MSNALKRLGTASAREDLLAHTQCLLALAIERLPGGELIVTDGQVTAMGMSGSQLAAERRLDGATRFTVQRIVLAGADELPPDPKASA